MEKGGRLREKAYAKALRTGIRTGKNSTTRTEQVYRSERRGLQRPHPHLLFQLLGIPNLSRELGELCTAHSRKVISPGTPSQTEFPAHFTALRLHRIMGNGLGGGGGHASENSRESAPVPAPFL